MASSSSAVYELPQLAATGTTGCGMASRLAASAAASASLSMASCLEGGGGGVAIALSISERESAMASSSSSVKVAILRRGIACSRGSFLQKGLPGRDLR